MKNINENEKTENPMRRIKLTVAYDGTNYVGWQTQPNGVSIEEKLDGAVSRLTGRPTRVIGASRTDSGVHALGAVCTFDTDMQMPAEKFTFALNPLLPDDIVIQASEEVDITFHPRYDAKGKIYVYKILNRRLNLPLQRFDTYFYYKSLDVERMDEAAQHLQGTHDFISFASPHFTAKTTIRTLYECNVRKDGDIITIYVKGDGFLYNMVRIIAGTLIRVGAGAMEPSQIPAIFDAKDRDAAGPTAPAKGLTLVETLY